MQARYQYGNLAIRKRKKSPAVWQYRWTENGRLKSMLIGTVEKLPARADAERAVEYLRMKINARNPQQRFHSVTVGGLIDKFMAEYAPRRCRRLTQKTYHSFFKNHIRPRWGDEFLEDVRPARIQEWLDDYPYSRQIKSHVKTLMHTLFQAAIWWEMIDRNPLSQIREPRKRLKKPRLLSAEEFQGLIAELQEPFRTMVIVAACLGLRVSELVGLKWSDFDFAALTLTIRRSVVEGEVNETKTESSESTLPLDPGLARILLAEKSRQDGPGLNDWAFGSAEGHPRWPDSMLAKQLKPAAARAGLGKVGWHTFRHMYSSMLHSAGTSPAVQKELLRHADISTTMNVYTQALSQAKRDAASQVADRLIGSLVPVCTFERPKHVM